MKFAKFRPLAEKYMGQNRCIGLGNIRRKTLLLGADLEAKLMNPCWSSTGWAILESWR